MREKDGSIENTRKSESLSSNINSITITACGQVIVVQLLSHVWFFATPWTAPCQASLSFTISWHLLKLISIESMMTSNCLVLCHPFLLLPSIFPSIRVFSNESVVRMRWPKYWSFSFSISPSNEYSPLFSFRIDWSDLLTVQGTLKSLLQHPVIISVKNFHQLIKDTHKEGMKHCHENDFRYFPS